LPRLCPDCVQPLWLAEILENLAQPGLPTQRTGATSRRNELASPGVSGLARLPQQRRNEPASPKRPELLS
jgi:hypothetical protein